VPIKQISPFSIEANGFWNCFTNRKKYRITCGDCGYEYKDKVCFSKDEAASTCPECKTLNIWSHSNFKAAYDKNFPEN